MASLRKQKENSSVVSALDARSNFGQILSLVSTEQRSLVIEKRGTPQAVILSLRDYVKLAAPEPEILKLIGEASRLQGTSRLSSRQIDQVIRKTRNARRKTSAA